MKSLLIFISIVSITASGFLGVITGAMIGQEWKSLLMVLAAMLLSSLLALISLGAALRLKPITLLPALGLIAACIMCGLAYNIFLIPEGFKLIIIAIILLISGFLVSKSIKNNLKNTQP